MAEQPVEGQPTAGPDWLQDLTRGIPPLAVAALAFVLIVGPALATLAYINRYGVNGPYWDHLTSAEIFERWHAGSFTLEFLFSPHNEHRKAVPRLVVLGLGLLTDFNNKAEMYLQWLLLCGSVGLLFAAFRREARLFDSRARAVLLFLPAAWLLVSVRQYEIMLVGDGLLTYLSLLCFVASLYFLTLKRESRASLPGAVAFGVVTTFSQSNGMLIWPIGVLVLAAETRSVPGARSQWRLAAWAACGALVLFGYFYGYQDPGNHPSPRFFLQQPATALAHLLAVGGGSLSPEMRGAVAGGIVVLGLEVLLGAILLYEWLRYRERPPLGAWLVLCALTTQVMISLNRAGLGMGQGLSPRYATYSSLAPIGLYWCTVVRRDRWGLSQPLALALATVMAMGFLSGTLDGWTQGPKWFVQRSWQAYLLYTARWQPTSLLKELYPNPDHARIYATTLERLRLNVFAEDHLRPETLEPIAQAPPHFINVVNGKAPDPNTPFAVSGDDTILVAGWVLGESHRPAPAVFVTIDGQVNMAGHIGIDRPDVATTFGTRRARWSGFVVTFSASKLTPGEHTLAVKIATDDRRHAYVTPPVARVIVR